MDHGAGAHGAGFDGDVEGCPGEAIISDTFRGFTQSDYFGVRGGIAIGNGAVSGAGYDLLIDYYNGADGHFAEFGCAAGFFERGAYEAGVVVSSGNVIESAHFWQDSMECLLHLRVAVTGSNSLQVAPLR